MNSSGRKEAAAGPLDLLAAQLRDLGLTVMVAEERTPFPALLVSAGMRTAVIMAGRVHYWRRRPDGDMRRVARLDEPEQAARTVHERLMVGPRHARRSRPFPSWMDAGASVGVVRGLPPVEHGPRLCLVEAGGVAR